MKTALASGLLKKAAALVHAVDYSGLTHLRIASNLHPRAQRPLEAAGRSPSPGFSRSLLRRPTAQRAGAGLRWLLAYSQTSPKPRPGEAHRTVYWVIHQRCNPREPFSLSRHPFTSALESFRYLRAAMSDAPLRRSRYRAALPGFHLARAKRPLVAKPMRPA